jgi:hypothetical protein
MIGYIISNPEKFIDNIDMLWKYPLYIQLFEEELNVFHDFQYNNIFLVTTYNSISMMDKENDIITIYSKYFDHIYSLLLP